MKNKVLYVLMTVFAAVLLVVGVIYSKNGFKPKYDGLININVVDFDGVVLKEKDVSFKAEDKLENLVKDNFENVSIENGMLMSIESLVTPSDWSTFIAIYINDALSNYGIADLPFENGDKISFKMTSFSL